MFGNLRNFLEKRKTKFSFLIFLKLLLCDLCAEVNILWAAHQLHHTSEDFNMSVGVRHSALQAISIWVTNPND